MNIEEGVLHDVLHLMKLKGESLSAINKLVILSFDEIYISQKAEIDKKFEQVVGPCKTAQVCIARGLFKNYKQQVFYKFDQNLTSDILNDIIKSLWDVGYTVVGVVTDLGGNNPCAFKKFKIGVEEDEKCYFKHPCDQNLKRFVFADTHHI